MGRGKRERAGRADLYIGGLPQSPEAARYCVACGPTHEFGREDLAAAVLPGSAIVAEYRSRNDLLEGMYIALVESADESAAQAQAARLEALLLDAVSPCTRAAAAEAIEDVDGVLVTRVPSRRLRRSGLAAR